MPEYRSRLLANLGPHLPPELLAEILTIIRQISNVHERSRALGRIVRHLPPESFGEAIIAAREIENTEALSVVQQIEDEQRRCEALSHLVYYQPPETLGETLTAIRQIKNVRQRSEALARLALPCEQKIQVLAEALIIACQLDNEGERMVTLREVTYQLTELPQPVRYALWSDVLPRSAIDIITIYVVFEK